MHANSCSACWSGTNLILQWPFLKEYTVADIAKYRVPSCIPSMENNVFPFAWSVAIARSQIICYQDGEKYRVGLDSWMPAQGLPLTQWGFASSSAPISPNWLRGVRRTLRTAYGGIIPSGKLKIFSNNDWAEELAAIPNNLLFQFRIQM